jgi:hypothetical protein
MDAPNFGNTQKLSITIALCLLQKPQLLSLRGKATALCPIVHPSWTRGDCYEAFYGRKLRIFVAI